MPLIVNLFLLSSWYVFFFRKKSHISFVDRLIAVFVLYLSQIIMSELLLGAVLRELFPTPLFMFNISISLIVFLASFNLRGHGRKNHNMLLLKEILLEIRDRAHLFLQIMRRDYILCFITVLFLISLCSMVITAYLFPSYTWDALWYHLPMVGYMMQSGAVEEVKSPFFIDMFINIFPKNIELFFLWNVIFLKSGTFMDLSQMPFILAGMLAVYSIGTKLRIRREYALYSALLFFFTPVIILQATTNYIDIAVSTLFLISVNYLINAYPFKEFNDKKSYILHIVPAGLAAGILAGAKGSGPLFLLILSVAVMIGILFRNIYHHGNHSGNHNKIEVITSFRAFAVCFIAPAFITGGYWYVKNWAIYGNPVYPIEVSLFNITLFKGLYGGFVDPIPKVLENLSPLGRLFHSWLERVDYYFYNSSLSGFGPLWFILLLPCTAVAVFYAFKNRRSDFMILSALIIISFVAFPRNWNARYVIFTPALGTLSFGMTLHYLEKKQKTIKFISVLLVIYTFLTVNSPDITPNKVAAFAGLPAGERTLARLAPFDIDLQTRQDYGLWTWIQNNIRKGDVMAYTFEPLFLGPLWNSGFSNAIKFVKADSFDEWLEMLKKSFATDVLIKRNSIEDRWTNELHECKIQQDKITSCKYKFNEVYSDDNYKVLRVIKGENQR